MKKIIFTLLSLILTGNRLFAQEYVSTELSIVKPSQVIIENYITVNLSTAIIDDPKANKFDVSNPYTYLQLLNDKKGNTYHIILQSNFSGKILFLCYSNNLTTVFNKADKPAFLFTHCLKEINNHISSVQVMNNAIKCIVERLNYCSDD
ncbi:hypothetical protein BH11BAC4_BH11BAC4_20600 [soil metagenome]